MQARVSNLLAASVLVALTVAVFAASRNTGPESSIRRFHLALLNRREADFYTVVLPPKTPPGATVAAETEFLLRRGARVRLGAIEKRPPRATVEVAYIFDNGVYARRFALVRQRGTWMLDLDETARLMSPMR